MLLGAIVGPVALFSLMRPQPTILPTRQSAHIAEMLAQGLKQNPCLFSSPYNLDAFIDSQNESNRLYFTNSDLLLAIVGDSHLETPFFLFLPKSRVSISVGTDGNALFHDISRTDK